MAKGPANSPAFAEDLTPIQIMTLLHAHAMQIKNGNPKISNEEALQQAAQLAVLAFDALHVHKLLAEAAELNRVPSMLAELVMKSGSSASASLTDAA